MTSEILMDATTHQAVEVRCAAIEALGDFGDISALEHLDKLANHRTLFGRSRFTSIQETARRAAARIRREHTRAA
jgi:HEAT repeat protein